MNVDDMAEHKLKAEDVVDIHNRFGGRHRVAQAFKVVPYDIPRGCVATYFPEANVLVPIDKFAKTSLTPASKSSWKKYRAASRRHFRIPSCCRYQRRETLRRGFEPWLSTIVQCIRLSWDKKRSGGGRGYECV